MRPDYKPKRCYVDDEGNTINPKTSWDDLLKYYRSYRRLLGVGDQSRFYSSSTPTRAMKLIIAEKIHQDNKRRAAELESEDLQKKEKKRRKEKRERISDLAADYLDKVHSQY
ncbi:MAG: hypothetical protein ACOC88_00140 [Candidatus Bipolaricaulota bacterium]